MGKRKTAGEAREDSDRQCVLNVPADEEGAPRKKHKKNKHKKKARSRAEEGSSRVVEAEPGVRPLTLKIKLGKKRSEARERYGVSACGRAVSVQ